MNFADYAEAFRPVFDARSVAARVLDGWQAERARLLAIESAAKALVDAEDALDSVDGGCGWTPIVAAFTRRRDAARRALRTALGAA